MGAERKGTLGVGGVVAILIASWLVILLLCWLMVQLFRQNGAILLRLEALEEMRNAAPFAGTIDEQPFDTGGPLQVPAADLPGGVPHGTVLGNFELPGLDGAMRHLTQWRGRRVLLIYFDPACGFSRQMLPELGTLNPQGDPMPVIITTGDRETNRALFAEHGVQALALFQEDREVATYHSVEGTPAAYLIDEAGLTTGPLAVGAEAVLALARGLPAPAAPADGPHRVTRTLADSRLVRDGIPVGALAPDFTLPRIDGGDLHLAAYRGRRVLLVFSDPNCSPCEPVTPALERIHRSGTPLAVIMVSRGGLEANQAKIAEFGLTYPVVLQRHWEISRLYGMFATPIAFLIDERGIIAKDVAVGAEAILDLAKEAALPRR